MRLQFVPGREPPALLDLPWDVPLAEWAPSATVRMAHGLSRHVVRFVREENRVYALKELGEREAAHEYAMLRLLAQEGLPVVEAVGLASRRVGRDDEALDAVLVTRYLDYSLPFHYVFGGGTDAGSGLWAKLIDAGVVLLVRLHLNGFFWGDCSLSNLLFRRDAGSLMAYLVDAETAERHDPLPDGMRAADLDVAKENVVGGLLDLVGAGRLDASVDAVGFAEAFEQRYLALWDELTGTQELAVGDRHLIEQRVRRLNELGFDVGEIVVEGDGATQRLQVTPVLIEEGHHSRELLHLVGLRVQENQARRLLNDIAGYGAYLAQADGAPSPSGVVAARWLAAVYRPVVAAVPVELRGRLEEAELFHEVLEHRYYLSEKAGHDIGTAAALQSYVDDVLRARRSEQVLLDEGPG